ncbi:hypothetical protein Asppvi_009935 [Aspergillus pseudoviridinutans]|uniref:Uncharacterized protein n=1 Tax=Aspergillus pseudoviridinutans TaxID=1517512 RepID=A0A9P3EZL6_9EURO|nr:uncharacterized protein Asppvi_009935 [Aspergillus pseudoviridinutans]GIJ90970.1 hypothetical protein Asppvi_009935 [Aspergillus pseudoviridinutans]
MSVIEKTYTLPPAPTGYVERSTDIEDYIREHYGPAFRVSITLSQDRWKITTDIDLDQAIKIKE